MLYSNLHYPLPSPCCLYSGDTGPLVYPAGFLYIFSGLKGLTGDGENVFMGQVLFAGMYVFVLVTVLKLYAMGKVVPAWGFCLLVLSKRMHSIFVLRLFNDCVAILFGYLAIYCFTKNKVYAAHAVRRSVVLCRAVLCWTLLLLFLSLRWPHSYPGLCCVVFCWCMWCGVHAVASGVLVVLRCRLGEDEHAAVRPRSAVLPPPWCRVHSNHCVLKHMCGLAGGWEGWGVRCVMRKTWILSSCLNIVLICITSFHMRMRGCNYGSMSSSPSSALYVVSVTVDGNLPAPCCALLCSTVLCCAPLCSALLCSSWCLEPHSSSPFPTSTSREPSIWVVSSCSSGRSTSSFYQKIFSWAKNYPLDCCWLQWWHLLYSAISGFLRYVVLEYAMLLYVCEWCVGFLPSVCYWHARLVYDNIPWFLHILMLCFYVINVRHYVVFYCVVSETTHKEFGHFQKWMEQPYRYIRLSNWLYHTCICNLQYNMCTWYHIYLIIYSCLVGLFCFFFFFFLFFVYDICSASRENLSPNFIIVTIFTSNFIGIVFARSLHYQFYCWWGLTLWGHEDTRVRGWPLSSTSLLACFACILFSFVMILGVLLSSNWVLILILPLSLCVCVCLSHYALLSALRSLFLSVLRYFHTLPYLAWHAFSSSSRLLLLPWWLKLGTVLGVLLGIEVAFNVYPATPASSLLLQVTPIQLQLQLYSQSLHGYSHRMYILVLQYISKISVTFVLLHAIIHVYVYRTVPLFCHACMLCRPAIWCYWWGCTLPRYRHCCVPRRPRGPKGRNNPNTHPPPLPSRTEWGVVRNYHDWHLIYLQSFSFEATSTLAMHS